MRNKSITLMYFAVLCGMLHCLPNEAFTFETEIKRIVIIGNKELPFDSISRNELNDIFHCKKTMWDDNQKIEIAILTGSKTHQQFDRYYIQETSTQYPIYLKNNLLLGRDCSCITFRSEKSLISHVALTKGAIGYISSYIKPTGVKVIKIKENY
jgi:ABC-type phosphate transport system substrate-binding protein